MNFQEILHLKPPPVSCEELIVLLNRHSELFEVVKILKDICKIPFLYLFIINSSLICSLAFRVSINKNFFIFYALIYQTLRVFIEAFFCQLLKNASEEVSSAIYDCGWEHFKDEKHKNLVKFALMRAQRPAVFKILDRWIIDLELFANVSDKIC